MNEYFDDIRKFNLWDNKDYSLGIMRDVYHQQINNFINTKLIKVLF